MMRNSYINNYFLVLFCIIPISFIAGSAVIGINILLIDIPFLVLILISKNYQFLKNKSIFYLLILYLYLIFNTIISLDYTEGLLRNLGFIRFIIFFAAFNYFFLDKSFYTKVFNFWIIVFLIISIDVFIEQFTGTNILGFSYGDRFNSVGVRNGRIVSFFKDEPVVGGFINGFFLLLSGFLLNKLKKKKFFIFMIITAFLFLAIILSGERSNTIKALCGLLLFVFLIKQINLRYRISIILGSIFLITVLIINLQWLNIRFVSNIKSILTSHSIYFDLYKSGFNVFKNHKLVGVGNKNYRIESCSNIDPFNKDKEYYFCNNHPHQIYFELLSEHGIIGTFIIFFILFKLVFSKIPWIFNKSNYLKIGSLIYIIFIFTPIIPSGAFFTNNLMTIFMINLSVFFAIGKNSNIFSYDFPKKFISRGR